MSILTYRSGVNNHPEITVLALLTALIARGGVESVIGNKAKVSQKSGTPNRSVDVATGIIFVKGSTGSAYPIVIDSTYNVAIDANTSGNPRVDTVVAYHDQNATPVASGQGADVAKIVAVKGSPAASPSAPDDGTIQTAIGANCPFEKLSNVAVANNATTITDAEITDARRVAFIKGREALATGTTATGTGNDTYTPDVNVSRSHVVTMGVNTTLGLPINMEIGDSIDVAFIQNATGSKTLTIFPTATITWLTPDYSVNTGANKKSCYVFKKTGANTFDAWLSGKEYT